MRTVAALAMIALVPAVAGAGAHGPGDDRHPRASVLLNDADAGIVVADSPADMGDAVKRAIAAWKG